MDAYCRSRDILKRKKQVPDPAYAPKDVVRTCLSALQNNDDPQLDHGACVVLEFRSPAGPLSEGGLDPSEYGRFLRSTHPYNALLDFKSAEAIGDPESISGNEFTIRQGVKLKSFEDYTGTSKETLFDFYLSKHNDTWLLDVILHREGSKP